MICILWHLSPKYHVPLSLLCQKIAITTKPKHESTKSNCSSVTKKLSFSTGLRVRSCFWKTQHTARITWCILCLSSQIRTVCYGSQLVGGALSRKPDTDASVHQLGKSLLLFSAQLSHCRTVLRLFDDLSMLAYSHSYGMGTEVTTHCSILKQTGILCTSPCQNGDTIL